MSGNQSIEQWIPARCKAPNSAEIVAKFSEDEQKVWPLIDGIVALQEIAADAGVSLGHAHRILLHWEKRGLITWVFGGSPSGSFTTSASGHFTSPSASGHFASPSTSSRFASTSASGHVASASTSSSGHPARTFSSGGFQAVVSSPSQGAGSRDDVSAFVVEPINDEDGEIELALDMLTPMDEHQPAGGPESPQTLAASPRAEDVAQAGPDMRLQLQPEADADMTAIAPVLPKPPPVSPFKSPTELQAQSFLDDLVVEDVDMEDVVVEDIVVEDVVVEDIVVEDVAVELVEEPVAVSPFEPMTPPPPSSPSLRSAEMPASPFEPMTPPPPSVTSAARAIEEFDAADIEVEEVSSPETTAPTASARPRIPGASSGAFPAAQGSSPALRIPGAASGAFPAAQDANPALRIPGAASGSSPSNPALQIPGASSGSWPRAGASSESHDAVGASGGSQATLRMPGASSARLPRAGGSQENLRIPGASSGSWPRAGGSQETMLKIPGAGSGSYPRAGDSQATMLKIPGAGSGSYPQAGASGEMTTADGIRVGRTSPDSFDASTFGDHTAINARTDVLHISEKEQEAFAEVLEQVEEIDTTRINKDKFTWAREIATAFGRVTRTFQLYDANNDAVRDALAALFTQLMGFLKENERLMWVIQPWDLMMDGESIYHSEDREYSIAYKLYRDGIRGLTLVKGLNWEELAQLLKIFGMRYDGVHMFEDDVATLFWKFNFRHVEVIAIEGFGFERREEGEEPSIQSLVRRIQRIYEGGVWKRAETPGQKASMFGGARGRGAALSPAVREENAQGLLRELTAAPIQYKPISETDVKPLHNENKLEKLHEQMAQLFRYIDKIVLDLSAVTGLEGLKHLLREYRNFLITDGRPEGLEELLKRAERWTQLIDNRGRILAPLAEDLLSSFEDVEVIRRFLGAPKLLDAFGNIPESTYNVLAFGNRDRRPFLLQILEEEKSERVKEVVRRALVHLCGEDITLFVRALQRGVTELSIQMVDCLQMVGTRDALEVIASLMESSNPDLQEKVVGMAEQLFRGPESFVAVRSVLIRLLESNDVSERMRAYRLMEANEDHRWVPMLRKELQSKRTRGDKEVEEMARLAARLDASAIMPLLLEWVEPPRMLSMERSSRKQLRYAAVCALGQTGDPVADQAIRKLMDRSDGELREACMEAMREIRRNRGVDPLTLPKRLQKTKAAEPELLDGDATSLADSRQDLVSSAQEVDLKRLQDMMIKSLQHIDFKTENEFSSQVRELGHQFVISLNMLIKNRALYDPNNEIFLRPLREIGNILDKMLEHLMAVTLVGMEGQFYINDVRIRMQSENSQQIFRELSQLFDRLKLGGITFALPLFEREWRQLVDFLSGQGEGVGRMGWRDIRMQLAENQMNRKIELFGQLSARLTGEKKREGARSLPEIFIDGCDAVEDVWYFVVRGQPPNPLPIRRFVNDLIDSLLENEHHDLAILALEDPEEPLKTHWLQVTLLSLLLGKELQLSRAQLADLGMAAFFHDIGHAVFIDPEVRRGEGWQVLNHQQAGMGLLLKHRGFNEAKVKRLLAIMEHHANAFPLASQPKPALYSRIVRVADAYDTLTTALCGGAPLSPTEALEHIASGCEKQFDPFVVQALVNILGHYPPGTIVALHNGNIAVSMGNNGVAKTFELPQVLFLYDGQGQPLSPEVVDLSESKDRGHRILGIVPYDPALQPKKHVIKQLWPEIYEAVMDETMMG